MINLHGQPLRSNCELEGVKFDQEAFWHSSAHILGYAIELFYKEPLLTYGPATEDGFFYDFWLRDIVS